MAARFGLPPGGGCVDVDGHGVGHGVLPEAFWEGV